MSKFRVDQQKIISKGGNTQLQYELTANNKALALFSVRERAAILKACAEHMGKYWIATWLPERFSGYARRLLGYKAKPKYEKSKRKLFGQSYPLTLTGSLLSAAEGATAKGQSGGPGGSPSVILRIPTGDHPLAAIVQQVLKTIPATEVEAMGKAFGGHLTDLINNINASNADNMAKARITKIKQRVVRGILSKARSRREAAWNRDRRAQRGLDI